MNWLNRQTQREAGLSRAVQITQWTFMARPGHPVFLDAIGRIIKKSEENARKEMEIKAKGGEYLPESAVSFHLTLLCPCIKLVDLIPVVARMDWPSCVVSLSVILYAEVNSTDCVYRYLLARYGFTPSMLVHQKIPIRVGDVLYVACSTLGKTRMS